MAIKRAKKIGITTTLKNEAKKILDTEKLKYISPRKVEKVELSTRKTWTKGVPTLLCVGTVRVGIGEISFTYT